MSNFPLSADIVMDMGTLPDHARKKLRKKMSKRREINGHKFKKLVQKSKETNLRDKEEKWGRVAIPPGRNKKKLEQL